ncbi:MAG: M24 family metallopeptidase, partial [Ruminococcus sp.]|nr:M24 family metallopeptidase [Ruminococcus sp.]
DIDKTARDIISDSGYGKNFGHSTGHGVGLDIHEKPFVSSKSETILSDNMVITVEPGIYLENRFGVRIEDMILVKENGFSNFATLPKELIVV